MEEGQAGNEIVTAPVKGMGLTAAPGWEMLKGFVFPSAGAQGEPSRTDPKQNYNSERSRGRHRARADIIPHY